MLKEYMGDAAQHNTPSSGTDAVNEIGAAFNGAVNFLHNPEGFRDPVTNIITDSGYKIIGAQCVQVGVVAELDVPSLSFVTVGDPRSPQAYIALPHRFHEMTADDPVLQLGAVAQMLERVRVFSQGHMRVPNDELASIRANAVEASAVSELATMLEAEGVDYTFTPAHTLQLLDYADGTHSLSYEVCAGGVSPQRADHIKPSSPLGSRQINAVGEVDAAGCLSTDIVQVSAIIAGLQQMGSITSYKDVEYYLRQVASPVFLHAYPADHFGDQFKSQDLLTHELTEFGLGITVVSGIGESPGLTKSLQELDETYEENVEKLDKTGGFILAT